MYPAKTPRLPNAMIDVVCGERAHSAYDICPYVRSTFIYNVGGFTLPDIYTEIVGVLKVKHNVPINSSDTSGKTYATLK
jgi:hypothetical protein